MKRSYTFLFVPILLLSSCGLLNPTSSRKNSSSFNTSSKSSYSYTSYSEEGYPTDLYGNYYSNCLSWENGEDLKNKLYTAMHKGFKGIAYDGNWSTSSDADQNKYNHKFVTQLYTDDILLKDDHKSNDLYTGWDREHCFAKSLMMENPKTSVIGPCTDFHNLYAAWTTANVGHSNRNFGDIKDGEIESKTSPIGNNHFTEDKFEPASETDKGKAARAIFYIATMYGDETYGIYLREQTCKAGEKCHGNLSDLLSWNKFGISYEEYQHNKIIFEKYQFNRNPYIDYPELVDYIFGNKKSMPGELKYMRPSILDLKANEDSFSHYAITDCKVNYVLGDIFKTSEIKINKINHDFSIGEEVKNFETSPYKNNDPISLDKTKISVNINDFTIKYPIKAKFDPISKLPFKHKFATSDFIVTNSKDSQKNPINGIPFYETRESLEGSKKVSDGNEKGIGLGTSSAPIKSLIIESKSPFSFDNKTNITSIYFEGNIASGKTCDLTIKVGNNKVLKTQITYTKDGHNLYGVELDNEMTGKISFIFDNFSSNCSLYVYRIGIGAN